jgi:hypothetical protein
MMDLALPGSIEPAVRRPNLDKGFNPLTMILFGGILASGLLFVAYSLYADVDATGTKITSYAPFILLFVALLIALGLSPRRTPISRPRRPRRSSSPDTGSPSATGPSSRNSATCSSQFGRMSRRSRSREDREMRRSRQCRRPPSTPNSVISSSIPAFSPGWFTKAYEPHRRPQ